MTKEDKIILVVKMYLNNPSITIEEISKQTKISSSSVQRYLNDPLVLDLFDTDTVAKLEAKKLKSKVEGQRKGGINSFLNNVPTKTKNGQFSGNTRYKGKTNRLEQKNKISLQLYKLMITGKYNSLQELTDAYNEGLPRKEQITRDYVYDCFNASYIKEALGGELYQDIQKWLENNIQLANQRGSEETNSKKI